MGDRSYQIYTLSRKHLGPRKYYKNFMSANFVPPIGVLFIVQSQLLALQINAHRRGAYGDFHPFPSIPFIAFEHLSLYIQKNLSQSCTWGPLLQPFESIRGATRISDAVFLSQQDHTLAAPQERSMSIPDNSHYRHYRW